jgi:hypothetical protein
MAKKFRFTFFKDKEPFEEIQRWDIKFKRKKKPRSPKPAREPQKRGKAYSYSGVRRSFS